MFATTPPQKRRGALSSTTVKAAAWSRTGKPLAPDHATAMRWAYYFQELGYFVAVQSSTGTTERSRRACQACADILRPLRLSSNCREGAM